MAERNIQIMYGELSVQYADAQETIEDLQTDVRRLKVRLARADALLRVKSGEITELRDQMAGVVNVDFEITEEGTP